MRQAANGQKRPSVPSEVTQCTGVEGRGGDLPTQSLGVESDYWRSRGGFASPSVEVDREGSSGMMRLRVLGHAFSSKNNRNEGPDGVTQEGEEQKKTKRKASVDQQILFALQAVSSALLSSTVNRPQPWGRGNPSICWRWCAI